MNSAKEKTVKPLVNLLMAYPYLNVNSPMKLVRSRIADIRLLLDSGAFTAWRSGTPISLDDYCKFIEGLSFQPWRYFTLDVIGDPGATMKNYREMLRRGFNPVPIFTRGEEPSVINEYYKTSDVVGIGGLVRTRGNKGFVNGVMKVIGNRRVHWLGFTRLDYLKHYCPYMCDSSSWEGGARYGSFSIYMGQGQYKRLNKRDFDKRPTRDVIDRLRFYGVKNPELFRFNETWRGGRSVNRAVNATSAVAASIDIEKNIGTKFFNAASGDLAVSLLLEGFDYLTKETA